MKQISKALTKEFGKGFSLSNVYNMRQLYLDYPKFQSLTGKLTWTHYCELMSIYDTDRRGFYEKEKLIAQVEAVLQQWKDDRED